MDRLRGYRRNSLVIDFSPLPAKPPVQEVRNFVFEQLKLDMSKIRHLQLSMIKSYVFIELHPDISAEQLVTKFNKVFCITTEDGRDIPIPLFTADGAIEVRVQDLPPYMPNTTIAKHFSAYGEVLSITDEFWKDFFPGVANGTRIIRMRLNKSIPSYVIIEDEQAYVRYNNQTPTCRHCARNLHTGKKCSEVKKAIVSGGNTSLTLAQLVQGANPQIPQTPVGNPPQEQNQKTPSDSNLLPPVPTQPSPQEGPSNKNNNKIITNDPASDSPKTDGSSKVVEKSSTGMEIDSDEKTEPSKTQEPSGKRAASPELEDDSKQKRPSRSTSKVVKNK